jgi:hypothetical protein
MMLAALLLLVGAAAPSAAQGPDPSAAFAREALRICVDTGRDPVAIRKLAADEKWTPVDPLSLPARNRVVLGGKKKNQDRVFQRTAAWTVTKEGLALSIGLFDVPEALNGGRQCEVMAWDLDAGAVDAAFRADPRLKDQSMPGLPLKNYVAAGPPPLGLTYIPGDMGTKVLHVLTVR